MSYFPITESDEKEMLQEIGVKNFDELLKHIPKKLHHPDLRIPESPGEQAVQREIEALSRQNLNTADQLSFLGGGIYEHFIPSAISHLISRGEFLTAYTPYQAEASQGTLQAIYEFQTMICRLTGMDVSNASHYDGATALAEAVLLSLRHTRRSEVLMSSLLHPHYKEVIRTYTAGMDCVIREIPNTEEGTLDINFIKENLSEKSASVVISFPNFLGVVQNYKDVSDLAHEAGALSLVSVNPMSLSYFEAPSVWGADIVTGEAQPLGVPMSFGGPAVGFFATTKQLMRKIPGRISGLTKDKNGKRAFVLTLQAREQHIRREKATSNICSNQGLMALIATIYMSLLGKSGLKRVGEINVSNALYLRSALSKLEKFSIPFSGQIFNEFVLKYDGDVDELLQKAQEKGVFAGIDLSVFNEELKGCLLVCATETKTRDDLDRFVQILEEVA